MVRECLDIKMYESAVQLDRYDTPTEVKRERTKEITHPEGGQDTTVN